MPSLFDLFSPKLLQQPISSELLQYSVAFNLKSYAENLFLKKIKKVLAQMRKIMYTHFL